MGNEMFTSIGPPLDKFGSAIQALGEIQGTLSWARGEIADLPPVITDQVTIHPISRIFIPPTEPGLGSERVIPIPGDVAFGSPVNSDFRVTLPYVVSKLPLDTSIELEVQAQSGGGNFERSAGGFSSAVCTFEQPTVTQFDFNFLELK